MAARGRRVKGWRRPKGKFLVWELPIECLDRCVCPTEGSRHKLVNSCYCKTGYKCAMHCMQESMKRSYGPFKEQFTNEPLFRREHLNPDREGRKRG